MTADGTGVQSRAIALDVLDAVLARRAVLDDALADSPGDGGIDGLAPRDRAFVRKLVATTLRRLGQTDALIDHCLARPLPGRAGEVRQILRLGICQLVMLGTPPHAAVDSAVRLAVQRGHHHHKKLINAVLRRLSREGRALVAAHDAARINTPDWLWQSWSASFGAEVCRRIAECHLTEPPLDISAKAEPERWAAALDADLLPGGTLRLRRGGAPTALAGFDDGAWWVQDAAAALPARILLDGLGGGKSGGSGGAIRDRHIVDLCAAPGGKTAQLAAAGARVTAVDRSPQRLEVLRANLARLGLKARCIDGDAEGWRPGAGADAVLLDAPCTATGTIRRHPDIPHNKSPADVAQRAAMQHRLLQSAAAMVAPGGILVYSVCSLQPEEGVRQIEALLAGTVEFVRAPVTAGKFGVPADALTAAGDVQTLPCHLAEQGGMDGFFVARLRRT